MQNNPKVAWWDISNPAHDKNKTKRTKAEKPQVNKDIPIPKQKPGGRKKTPHQFQVIFDAMDVGDSLFLPNAFDPIEIHKAFSDMKRKHGWRVVTRKVVDDGVEGTRVWRLS